MQTWILKADDAQAWYDLGLQLDATQTQLLFLMADDLVAHTLHHPHLTQLQTALLQEQHLFCHDVPELFIWTDDTQKTWQIHLLPTHCTLPKLPDNAAFLGHAIEYQKPNTKIQKSWYANPPTTPIEHALVIGAGIAGASTAYSLAKRGFHVTVLEAKNTVGAAASGNQQGLLYAKISPHLTEQTQLLLAGYGYSLRLLKSELPKQETWQQCGVLHLNFNAQESKRNLALAQKNHKWFHALSAAQAQNLSQIPIEDSALFWPYGAWLNPSTLVRQLLQHDNIRVLTDCKLLHLERHNQQWQATTTQGSLDASHVFLCMGDKSALQAQLNGIHFNLIRGQTDLCEATEQTQALATAISGKSYVSPAWKNQHCFGASFVFHDNNESWRAAEQQDNINELQKLSSAFAKQQNLHVEAGHVAIRCDAADHLPVVGAIGIKESMQHLFCALKQDKNHHIPTPCDWYPNMYVNTAHGTRGLVTAPICAEAVVAEALGLPSIFSETLQEALHPNRFVIRDLIKQK